MLQWHIAAHLTLILRRFVKLNVVLIIEAKTLVYKELEGIRVYPNPATEEAFIDCSHLKNILINALILSKK